MNSIDSYNNALVILDGARYIMQEICEGFFEIYNTDNSEGKCAILHEFNRYRAYARILDNLLFDLSKQIESAIPADNENAEVGV